MVDAGSPLPFSNRAVLEQPIDDVRAVLDHIRAVLRRRAARRRSCSTARGRHPISAPIGFALMGHPPLMVPPAGAPFPRAAAGAARSCASTTTAPRSTTSSTLIYGYPAPQLQPMHEVTIVTPDALDAPGWHHFVGYVDDAAGRRGFGVRRRAARARRQHRDARVGAWPRLRPRHHRRPRSPSTREARDAGRERPRPRRLRAARLRRDAALHLLARPAFAG